MCHVQVLKNGIALDFSPSPGLEYTTSLRFHYYALHARVKKELEYIIF